ncbi:MAG TPA: T9SS type A sorting domain-containing protein, partial [Flavobacteriales bacterium]|nr:T9SS type A sorting domain-containing protein [Flavobacteriales bacterium]
CSAPTAGFTYSSSGLGLTCVDASSVTGTATYVWDFGDGSGTSTSQSPSYTYSVSGTYNVCLTLVDSCGTDSICQSIIVTDSSVGIVNALNEQVISVYPNPTREVIYFENTLNNQMLIYIYDAMGKLLQCLNLDENKKALNVENYSEGIYFYRVLEIDASNIFNGRFVVSK